MKFLLFFIAALLSFNIHAATTTKLSLVVGGPPGGALDNIARIMKTQLESQTDPRYQVEVLNRPGNGPVAAANFFLTNKNNTQDNEVQILLTVSSVLIPVYMQNLLPPDTDQKLQPLTVVGKMRPLIHANPALPINSIKDLDLLGKTHISFTTPGSSTTMFLIASQIEKQIKTPMVHVPVSSIPNALNMLLGGHVDLVFDVGQYYEMATSGKTKIVSIIGDKNWTEFGDNLLLPKQLPNKVEHDLSYYIIFGSARNNPALQHRVSQDLKNITATNPQFRQLLKNLHLELPTKQDVDNTDKTWTESIKRFKKLSTEIKLPN
jgi:tripartite-type tricarboxylate transporter receptor subunit TctC